MAIIRCEFGHYYDNNRNSECPHCLEEAERNKTVPGAGLGATSVLYRAGIIDASSRPDEVTVAGGIAGVIPRADEVTVAGIGAGSVGGSGQKSSMVVDMRRTPPLSDEKTVGVFRKKHGHDPVTGWLVCTKGPERGRDYRLYSGRNFVGRSPKSAIAVIEDDQISREEHCSVVFDPKRFTFLLVPGSANTYLNSEALSEPHELVTGDIIGAGVSEFVFIPFCTEGRTWEEKV